MTSMRIHHFFPRTKNVGDYFVQTGIATIVRTIDPDAEIHLFDVNSRGTDRIEYGLTRQAIEKANHEADLIIIGGSNLYEGAWGWPWGVTLDVSALKELRVPLFLIGIGTGSAFASTTHKPSGRAREEIRLLNDAASLSWVRDVATLEWLRNLGVTKAEMLGDPATFIFNSGFKSIEQGDHVLMVMPPSRIWSSLRGFRKAKRLGRPIFSALVKVAEHFIARGTHLVIACNDPRDVDLANRLFESRQSQIVCPTEPEEYFRLLAASRAVISGRLHTAAVALSLGMPFLLLDLDKRTSGFIETYQLDHAAISWSKVANLGEKASELLAGGQRDSWLNSIGIRNELYELAIERLKVVLEPVGKIKY